MKIILPMEKHPRRSSSWTTSLFFLEYGWRMGWVTELVTPYCCYFVPRREG